MNNDKGRTKIFGPHLIIDGYDADSDLLDDKELMYSVLDELPELIGMHKIDKPKVYKFDQTDIAGASIFGFCIFKNGFFKKFLFFLSKFFNSKLVGSVLIVESHISIHTYSKKDTIFIDIFSCKDFDTQKAINYLKEKYKIKVMDVQLIQRGKYFPVNNLHD